MKRIFSVIMALMLIISTTSQAMVVTINGQNCTYTMTSPANREITVNSTKGNVRWWKVVDTSSNIIGAIDGMFVTPTSNVTVTPMLEGNQIVVQQTANGEIKYNGTKVNTVETTEGADYTLTITPNEGYEIATVKVDNVELRATEITTSGMEYTFSNVDENHVITATYVVATTPAPEPEPATYTVSFNANGGTGTMENQTFTEGTAQTLSANKFTKTGYTFAGWTDEEGNTYTDQASFTATQNTILYAKWTPSNGTAYTVYHYVENIDNTNYTLYNTENKTGTTGATITLANEKTTIVGATYNKGTLTANGTETTTTTINANGTTKIYLYYTRNQYQLTLNKNANISSVSGAGTYKYGQNVIIDATVKSETGYNYTFTNWTSSNTSLLSNQTTKNTTITMPNGNITLTANANKTPITYTITATAGIGGTISPRIATVNYGESQTFTITANDGYVLKELKINGNTVSNTTSYTFNNVISNQTIEAIFEEGISIANIPVGAYVSYVPGTDITTSYDGGTYTPASYSLGWKVFENNNGQLNIISADSVGSLKLEGEAGYKNAVYILNTISEAYVNSTYATTGRSLGSTPNWSENPVDDSTMSVGKLGDSTENAHLIDELYLDDQTIINTAIEGEYLLRHSLGDVWLASRSKTLNGYTNSFYDVRFLNSDGKEDINHLARIDYNESFACTNGVRPIITLKSGLKVVSGDGLTVDTAYVLSN